MSNSLTDTAPSDAVRQSLGRGGGWGWRAQGRRTRLEFKRFRRHAMANTEPEPAEAPEPDAEPVDIEPAETPTVPVAFRLPAAVGAHSAQVCGDFNDWSTTTHPMTRLDDGAFETVLKIPTGRRWRYRYLLDDHRWENDWAADDYEVNTYGDHDSVVDLTDPSTSRLVALLRAADHATPQ